MTIKDAAAKYGVSRQAIYQRLKRQGLQVDALRNPDTGELTADGEAVLSSMFTEAEPTQDNAQAQVDTLTTQLATITEERDFLRRALDQAQQLHAMTLQALPPPQEPGGVLAKIRNIFKR